ncbi:hypothetical protein K502DRAFT_337545 [Neoconidiobolus thromboides FSU 785]|nr:hypothetical protein K502DRAFT_337545 [Neoconidiobolus thromboides FSU 785]
MEEEHSYKDAKILVLGAGGLGCEILKNLALLGFKDITVIDMDTIDLSNLNRQFLFREEDIGKPKAEIAARFINNRIKGINVIPIYGKIQDHDEDFYSEFQIVISGLDSIEARRWMNATLYSISEKSGYPMPFIDGGTEGFKGQARVILFNNDDNGACFECSLDLFNKQTTYPICTIANTPRLPEHCIEWASVLEWPKVFPDKKLDKDDPEHVSWLQKVAHTRAEEFGIEGVTYSLTQGVIKNIIPAIASTNAVISAACCNEAYKLATGTSPLLNNYLTYSGNEGIYTYKHFIENREGCPVCSDKPLTMTINELTVLEDFIDLLKEKPEVLTKNPSISVNGKSIRMVAPTILEKNTRPNLKKTLAELFENGSELNITDSSIANQLRIIVNFT